MSNLTDVDAKLKCQAQSYLLSLERYKVYFYFRILQLLLCNFYAVHVAIQSCSVSMSMAKQLISELSNVLEIESSSDKNATDFYQQVTCTSSIGVGLPTTKHIIYYIIKFCLAIFCFNVCMWTIARKRQRSTKGAQKFCPSEQVKLRGATDIMIVRYSFAYFYCILDNQTIMFELRCHKVCACPVKSQTQHL